MSVSAPFLLFDCMIRDTVEETIAKFQMMDRRTPVLVGVSGGPDSVCLLRILIDLGYSVSAAHLNHGLRGQESEDDARFVAELAEALHIPVYVEKRDIRAHGTNAENAGRMARAKFFDYLAFTHGFARIALAHTADDRIETFFLNLLRGAGMDGLTAMEPVSGKTVRPLIEVRRAEIESHLRSIGQPWRTDSSNLDSRFARNHLRNSVIPELASRFNPNLNASLTRTINILDDENRFMAGVAESWLLAHAVKASLSEGFSIDAVALATEPVALQRRILRTALARAGSTLENVSFDRIEAVRELLQPRKSGKTVELPAGFEATRNFDMLTLSPVPEESPDFEYELQIPGEIHIREIGAIFRCELIERNAYKSTPIDFAADGGKVGPYVKIRNWKPGDYYKPAGWRAGKLKKLFQQARIPRNQRRRWPVVVAGSSIVWAASFPVSREFALSEKSQKVVAFAAIPI